MAEKQKLIRRKIITSLATIGIIGGSSGLIFGVTAYLYRGPSYINLVPYQNLGLPYSILIDVSSWSDENTIEPTSVEDANNSVARKTSAMIADLSNVVNENKRQQNEQIFNDRFENHFVDNDENNPYNLVELIIDGSTHAIRDRSFNGEVYNGITNWVHQRVQPYKTEVSPNAWDINGEFKIQQPDLHEPNGDKGDSYQSKAVRPISDQANGFIQTYNAAIASGFKTLVLNGYLHTSPLSSFCQSQKDTFKKANYILLDDMLANEYVASVTFRADQGSALCGIAACQLLQENYDEIYSKVNHGQLAVGTFGGLAIPTVTSFMGGFEWGIYFYNKFILPKINGYDTWSEATRNKRTVKILKLGRQSSYFTGTFTAGDARLCVQQLLADGADIILPVAGPQTSDCVNEIYLQHSPCRVIGVDTPQEDGDLGNKYSTSPLWKNKTKILCFSSIKQLGLAAANVLQINAKGLRGVYFNNETNSIVPLNYDGKPLNEQTEEIKASFIGGAGYHNVGSLHNNLVAISNTGKDTLINAFTLLDNSLNDYDKVKFYLSNELFEFGDPSQNPKQTFVDFLDKNPFFVF